ncbi:hypothetical protein [Xanthomonas campestris]|uniref:hypothetical protein n=1 Tax=Xanthomonas campestris TaxID=339 RepID=UPI002365DFD0|nr:hypothetical protein [Xanthomonas campestris]WDJ06260.1 hypothetical protein JH261_00770 [Xanthomonas campestris pv. incanae]
MKSKGEKGYLLEEVLRAYFLRAGMYAVRGVPLQIDGFDLTDVDIWIYERSTGSSRRRQIVDAKSKLKPKAVERLLWTRGLLELLRVDGAYVATTDNRPVIKEISLRLGISVLDGADLKRMEDSEKVIFRERISEEELDSKVKSVDMARRNKELQAEYQDLKAGLIEQFGAGTLNRSLDIFTGLAKRLVSSHPNSEACESILRLSYIAASVTALSLDFSLSKVSFKVVEDRRKAVLNIIRYGSEDERVGMEKVRIAAALVERYAPTGRAVAQSTLNSFQSDIQEIPAEIIADHVLAHLKGDSLFRMARSLEFEGFKRDMKGFDQLDIELKSFLGMLLDFSGLDRTAYADAWSSYIAEPKGLEEANDSNLMKKNKSKPLFGGS